MLDSWPVVLGEYETIFKLHDSFSISRIGDGECALARGAEYSREPRNDALAAELRQILASPDVRCLVGIPTLDARSPKLANWQRRIPQFLPFFSPGISYVSAFITRPDSAPWIFTQAYADAVQSLWRGKKIALVSEPTNKLVSVVVPAARKVVFIPCPHAYAYAQIDALEKAVLHCRPDIAILSCGPTASCLAHRLACHGVQALDLGSIGGMLARLLPGITQRKSLDG